MEQGCPHRSILPHIFPDCNSFAIKIGGKFCGVRGVCPGGGRAPALPARRVSAVPGGGACLLCRLPTLPLWCPQGGVPALSPANPAFNLLSCPYPPAPLPGGKGEIFCFLMQGAAPLASPGLNPRGTGSPCRCGKLNGGLAPALPARRASAIPGGGRACFVACLPCHCGTRRGACLLCRLLTLS